MGCRFRRSFKLAPDNITHRGTSWSVGGAPVTTNIGKRGIRTTYSLPGTGISYVKSPRRWLMRPNGGLATTTRWMIVFAIAFALAVTLFR